MSLLHQRSLSGKNIPKWAIILRVALGAALIYKGIDFIQHREVLDQYFSGAKTLQSLEWFVKFLPWVHIIGGVFIIVGLFTRFTALIQIPIILGAIVFVNLDTDVNRFSQSELPLSFLMLVLIIIFFVEGGGYMSLDNSIRKPIEDTSVQRTT